MNTTSLHIQIDPTIKHQAQETAGELGLSLSSVVKALLKQFIRTKRLSVGMDERPEIPNAYLSKALKQSEEDTRTERTQAFASWDTAFDYLSHEINIDKRATR